MYIEVPRVPFLVANLSGEFGTFWGGLNDN